MPETIKVVYEPLGTLAGVTRYHETLVYTNSQGQIFVASAGPNGNPTGSSLSNVAQASTAVETGSTSPYGTLYAVTGSVNDASVKTALNLDQLLSPSNPTETVASAADLHAQWDRVTSAEGSIQSGDFASIHR